MTFLYVLAAIVFVIALISFLPLWICVKYSDELTLDVGLGLIKYRITPKPKKKIKLSDYSAKALRKKRMAEKKKSAKKKKGKAEAAKKAPAKEKKKRTVSDILALVRFVLRVAKILVKKFGSYLKIKINRIVLNVATGDAASTAITYGAVSQAMAYLFALLENTLKIKYEKDSETYIGCDFLGEKWSADIDITFSIRIWQIVSLALKAAILLITKKTNQ